MSGGATQSWIMSRICAALDQADVARATVNDLDDHVLVGATIQLAEDLEAFALSLAGRLSELDEHPEQATGCRSAVVPRRRPLGPSREEVGVPGATSRRHVSVTDPSPG
jgi:hypothetical protein